MTWNLVFSPLAVQDIRQAASYYQDVAPHQVERFLDNVQAVTEDLARHPYFSTSHPNGLRRHSVKAFPYGVWIDVDETTETVSVLGVVHNRRDPRIIDERAEDLRASPS